MDKNFSFQVNYFATEMESFDELQAETPHDDPMRVILEALAYHRFYKQYVTKADQQLVMYSQDSKDACAIDDMITTDHTLVLKEIFTVSAARYKTLAAEFNAVSLSEEITHALALYEQIKAMQREGYELAIYTKSTKNISVYNLDITFDPSLPETMELVRSPAEKSPTYH
jgi:hypothetical protein